MGKVKSRLFVKNRAQRIAIFGLGGIGKTQIALELAYQTREIYPGCAIFWLPAVDMESLQQAYQAVADKLGISLEDRKEDPKSLVKDHLSKPSSGRWLLIFDNVDEIDMWTESKGSTPGGLKDYLPISDQGAILFTTRSNKVAQYLAATDIIKIPEMDEHRASNVLRNSLIDKRVLCDAESTRKLLSRLTFLPLAIVQAASFINENGTTLAGYVELLDGQEQSAIDLLSEDFEDKGRYKSIRNPVATTWLTSFEQIKRQNPLATEYLCFMACIQERDILISLLPPAPDVEQQKAIGLLSSYSFVRVRHDESRLDMHRLVHLATRNWLQSINSLRKWQLDVLCALDVRFPSIDVVNRTQWRASVPHALQVLTLTAGENPVPNRVGVLLKVATCQMHDGRRKQAEELFVEMVKVSETLFGPENQWTIVGLSGLANSYSGQGKSEKAIELCKRILEMQERLRGSESIEVTRGIFQLMSAYRNVGQFEKAVELCREVVQRLLKSVGPNSGETLNAIYVLTLDHFMHGRLSDALELSIQSLHIHKMTFGLEDPRTIGVMTSMAVIYINLWRLKEAESLLTDAAESHKRIFGNEHPGAILIMSWLAVTWRYQGRYKDAIALRTDCLRISALCFGLEHEYTQAHHEALDAWTCSK